ncbi:DUF1524 domain-containing protein [Peptococcaceae bacterium]|nr:DUF1524 domain-containing protein [Peptococcaceae bacterium]
MVSFNGYYSSQTDTKLDKDLEVIKESAYFPWDKLLENMQNKKAKVKITLNDVKKGLSLNVLRLQGRSHLFLLLEQNLNPEDQDTKEILINNLANITFIHKDINSEIEDKPYEYLNDYIDNVLV